MYSLTEQGQGAGLGCANLSRTNLAGASLISAHFLDTDLAG